MSFYTTQLRYICESLAGYDRSKGYMSIEEILNKSWDKIFPPSFQTFEESYRPVLAKKILKWYYTREIGSETFGLFQLRLDAKLEVIMPYYNKIYSAFALDYDLLKDTDIKSTHKRENEGQNKSDTKSTNSSNDSNKVTNRHSNTPQGGLDALESDRYLSSGDITDSSSKSSNNNTIGNTGSFSSTEDYVESIVGKRTAMTYTGMIAEYVEKLKNVDHMVINELSDLFIQTYDWGEFDGI